MILLPRQAYNCTLLHQAAEQSENDSHVQLAQELVSRGSNIHACDKGGSTPLHYAARSVNNPKLARTLLEAKCDPNLEELGHPHWKPMQYAQMSGSPETMDILRQYGAHDCLDFHNWQ